MPLTRREFMQRDAAWELRHHTKKWACRIILALSIPTWFIAVTGGM